MDMDMDMDMDMFVEIGKHVHQSSFFRQEQEKRGVPVFPSSIPRKWKIITINFRPLRKYEKTTSVDTLVQLSDFGGLYELPLRGI